MKRKIENLVRSINEARNDELSPEEKLRKTQEFLEEAEKLLDENAAETQTYLNLRSQAFDEYIE